MPHEVMNVKQVAAYLHLDLEDVVKLASRGALPARKVRGEYHFTKSDVDHATERILSELSHERLRQIEHGVSAHHGFDPHAPLVAGMIPPGGIAADMHSRSRDAVLRGLVETADLCGLVYDRSILIEEVRNREELCSTALAPHVALPHPRHPVPYDIEASFIIVGRVRHGIPFGSTDGGLTELFFLVSCKDDRTHLHVLARLSRMLEPAIVDALLTAEDGDEIRRILQERETVVLQHPHPAARRR